MSHLIQEDLPNLPKIEEIIKRAENCNVKVKWGREKPARNLEVDDIEFWTKIQVELGKECPRRDINIKYKGAEMLAVIDRAIQLKRNFNLCDTQKKAILSLLMDTTNTLAEVSMAEGKSLIIVALSIMKVLLSYKENVHVITRSSVLAKRDAEENRDIYELFNIKVSHNCDEDDEIRKKSYLDNQVVYGDLSNFQRDYLLHTFYGEKVMGDHIVHEDILENVIIDEVDSMLLDKDNNVLCLSHEIASINKLEPVYVFIWNKIKNFGNLDEKNKEEIKEAVVRNLCGLVRESDIGELEDGLEEDKKKFIWERLKEKGIIDHDGEVLIKNFDNNNIPLILPLEHSKYEDRLKYLLKKVVEKESTICVPKCLRSFVERHLESWIDSAKAALSMEAGRDYVVSFDRTKTESDLDPKIIIIDRDTGTYETNTQWDRGLLQFLELKHGYRVSSLRLRALFISNVSYLKKYRSMSGLTGNLGSQRERDLLEKLYKAQIVLIPTGNVRQFHEEPAIICESKETWVESITNEAKTIVEEKSRSILIICDTVNDVDKLHQVFGVKNNNRVHVFARDHEEFEFTKNKLNPGKIIIATNLVVRSPGIKISETLAEAGGLHVCLTYLPRNVRIERQAFDQATRCGQRGSGRLIIVDSNLDIYNLKMIRNEEEQSRLSYNKSYYENQINTENSVLEEFSNKYNEMKNAITSYVKLENEDIHQCGKILLQSWLDKWALWLDENEKFIENLKDEQNSNDFISSKEKFFSEIENKIPTEQIYLENCLDWVQDNSVLMVTLGKYLCKNKHYEKAIEIFNKVIKQDQNFSEAAYYYKAYALTKSDGFKNKNPEILKEFQENLQQAARLFRKRCSFATISGNKIDSIKEKNTKDIIQINGYHKQKTSIANVYNIYLRSINIIVGEIATPESFVDNNVHIKENMSEMIFTDLLENRIIIKNKPKLTDNFHEKEFKSIYFEYEFLTEELKSCLNSYDNDLGNHDLKILIKNRIRLPSREEFWKTLIRRKILDTEIKFIIVDDKKLRELDPSLFNHLIEKIKSNDLQKQILDSSDEGHIFINAEWIQEQNKNCYIFKKDTFKDIINEHNKNKYKILKERGVFLFNKRANISQGEIEFDHYDSICENDITVRAGIAKSEAALILKELAGENILQRDDDDSAYRLKIEFDKIQRIQLKSCPVYNDVVIKLLHVCFAYRIAFEQIMRQLKEKKFPICLESLKIKPHKVLFFELLKTTIFEPTNVEPDSLETKLKNIYGNPILTRDELNLMFSRAKLVTKKRHTELVDSLIEKKWITKIPKLSEKRFEQNITKIYRQFDDLFDINPVHLRSESLNFFLSKDPSVDININGKVLNQDETVEFFFNNRLKLSNDNRINFMINNLQRLGGLLNTLECYSKIKYFHEILGELGEIQNHNYIDEMMDTPFNSELDQVIIFKGNKWTREMLKKTLSKLGFGTYKVTSNILSLTNSQLILNPFKIKSHLENILKGINLFTFSMKTLCSGRYSDAGYNECQEINYTYVQIYNLFNKSTTIFSVGRKENPKSLELKESFSKKNNKGVRIYKKVQSSQNEKFHPKHKENHSPQSNEHENNISRKIDEIPRKQNNNNSRPASVKTGNNKDDKNDRKNDDDDDAIYNIFN